MKRQDLLFFSTDGSSRFLTIHLGDGRFTWSLHLRYPPITFELLPDTINVHYGYREKLLLEITSSSIIIHSDFDYIDRKVISNSKTRIMISIEEFQTILTGLKDLVNEYPEYLAKS